MRLQIYQLQKQSDYDLGIDIKDRMKWILPVEDCWGCLVWEAVQSGHDPHLARHPDAEAMQQRAAQG